MVAMQGAGGSPSTSIFCLSYSSSLLEDGSYGLSRDDWRRALKIAATSGNTSVVLWVDILDRANRSRPWGEEQLFPYMIYPVIFVATAKSRVKQESLRMWPAIEATMAQLGAGLITDRIAKHCGHFIPFQARSKGLYYSMTVDSGPEVEREAFQLHVASGRFRGCPTFHQGDYDRLLAVLQLANYRLWDEDGDMFATLERLELRFNGMATMKLEVTSTRWITTELPRWTGRKEWFPQEGGLISGAVNSLSSSKFSPGTFEGSYEVYVDEEWWIYCVVNRGGKKTLVRMSAKDGTAIFHPEQLTPNAYARIPAAQGAAFLRIILGIDGIVKLNGTFDLSKVEWE
ncbi:hypothetical protein FGB62_45g139 [Gracilaria domingensis]|nr:hypothetical protein FGB62_45g139 [Gracilaria domingensis]